MIEQKTQMSDEEIAKILNNMIDLTLQACKKDFMTKDGYGTLMDVVQKFNKPNDIGKLKLTQRNYILLCIQKGYPKDTGLEVIKILGLEGL